MTQRITIISSHWRVSVAAVALSLLNACALAPAPTVPEMLDAGLPETTALPPGWAASAHVGAVDDGWLQGFEDQRLVVLVDEMLAHNLSLEAAAAQVDAAAALARLAGASLKPAVGLAGGASSADASGLPGELQSSNAFLSTSWELDLWGRIRAAAAAGEASLQATESDYEYARQSLVAATAKAWFMATQIQAQLELGHEAVAIYTRLVELVQARAAVGKAQAQDLPLAQANLSAAQSNLRQVQRSDQQIRRGIEVLLGRYPAAELRVPREYVARMPSVPAGLPAEVLQRRPDLVAAERRVAAAFFGAEEARAARLPRITLTAVAGSVDSGLTDILNVGDPVAALSADLFAPLYTGGALEAGVEVADARQRALMAAYTQAVLRAFKEIETALSNEALLREREAYLQQVVDRSREAWRITRAQHEVGRVDLLTLLQTQAGLLSARSSLIAAGNDRLAQRVDLHLALGGSFEPR